MRLTFLVLLCAFIFSGCGCANLLCFNTEKLTPSEKLILSRLDDKGFCEAGRKPLLDYVRENREVAPDKPFCDARVAMNLAESKVCNRASLKKGIREAYREVYGRDYATTCGFTRGEPVEKPQERLKQDESVSNKTEWQQWKDAVKGCQRAETRLKTFSYRGTRNLTEKDKQDLDMLIESCHNT